jgi:carbonic anhydrase
MQKLLQGIHIFQTQVFRSKSKLFRELANGQSPGALFITCSDSRINPNLITQTDPGEIFVLRNAGNIIPPFPTESGEIATIEFAVVGLGIQDIIICGHSDCGAIKGLMNPGSLEDHMPSVYRWLHHAKRPLQVFESGSDHAHCHEHLAGAVEDNVMMQIDNLRTHSFIEKRLNQGSLKIHGWVYKFETGDISSFDSETEQFLPLKAGDDPRPAYPRSAAAAKVSGMAAVAKGNL